MLRPGGPAEQLGVDGGQHVVGIDHEGADQVSPLPWAQLLAVSIAPMTTNLPRYLGLSDIAADLGESPETVRKWVMDGRLGPAIKLPNGKWKVHRSDYEAWLGALVISRRI